MWYRILVQHIEILSSEKKSVNWHIESLYSDKMARKSKVVSDCAILLVFVL